MVHPFPMNILVIGASQGTGALAVKLALDKGHAVTAFARSPDKLGFDHPKLTKRVGDFHDPASVAGAVPGHDAVFITASATSFKTLRNDPTYFSRGTRPTIDAMEKVSVKRLVVLSALGVGDSRPLFPALLRPFLIGFLLKTPYVDHERQEQMVRASSLDWVIARPGKLTDGPAKGTFRKSADITQKVPTSISRADVAAFLVEACETDAWVHKNVQLGG